MDKWFVITGAPSSGITVTADYLSTLGHFTFPEIARVCIDSEIAKGKTIEEIRGDEVGFQLKALKMKQDIEKTAPKDRVVFFQRGIPDTIAYFKLIGADTKEILDVCKASKYKKVFLLETLQYKQDYARVEGEERARKIWELLKETYEELGFKIVHVPKVTIEERAHMILAETEKD